MKSEKGQAILIVVIALLIVGVGVLLALASLGVHNCAISLRELLQPWKDFCTMPVIPLPLGQ